MLPYHYLIEPVDLFGLKLDDSLIFGKPITKISKKVGKQLDVLCRLKNILSFQTKFCLYHSFIIMSHFYNCLKSDSEKLDRLHERALRYLYSDESSQSLRPISVKVIPWFCTAHLLLRITRWPP